MSSSAKYALSVIHQSFLSSYEEAEKNLFSYSIAVLVGVIGFYYVNHYWMVGNDAYENLGLRLLSGAAVLPLIFKDRFPASFKPFLPLYWYCALIYTIPIFFTFMLLSNHSSNVWHINGLIGLIVLSLFVDWVVYLILIGVGVFLGSILFYIKSGFLLHDDLHVVLASYIPAVFYIILFSEKKKKRHEKKMASMKLMAGAIAHEIRTPLSTISLGGDILLETLPIYEMAYKKAKITGSKIPAISLQQRKLVANYPNRLKDLTYNAQTIIDIILMNLSGNRESQNNIICTMSKCLEEAISQYPFCSNQTSLISYDLTKDFEFLGHPELMKHVFFNLIKNSLSAIGIKGSGKITIKTEGDKKNNKLHFIDTGSGIHKSDIPHVFDRFFTRSQHGSGVGLSFCKTVMDDFGGKIKCASKSGEYTIFTLLFPSI